MKLGADGRPVSVKIRGYNDEGDATEDFAVDASGGATWKTTSGEASAPFGNKIYDTKGGPRLIGENLIDALVAAGDKGVDILPSGHGSMARGEKATIDGPAGPRRSSWRSSRASVSRPFPIWLDDKGRFFGSAGIISMVPEGYEKNGAEAAGHPGQGDRGDGPRSRAPLSSRPASAYADADRPRDVVRFRRRAVSCPTARCWCRMARSPRSARADSLKAPAGATRIDGARQDDCCPACGIRTSMSATIGTCSRTSRPASTNYAAPVR